MTNSRRSICESHFGETGCQYVAKVLKHKYGKIRELSLANNVVADDTAKEVATSLEHSNNKLRVLE